MSQSSATEMTPEYINGLYDRTLLAGLPPLLSELPSARRMCRERKNAKGLFSLFAVRRNRHDPRALEDATATWVAKEHADFINALRKHHADGKTVLFIASRLTYKVYREALMLQDHGYRCALIVMEPLDDETMGVMAPAFQAICILEKSFLCLKALVALIPADIFHVHCRMLEYLCARAVNEGRQGGRLICELDDITSVYADQSVMREYWPAHLVDLDFAMERYICHHSDGLVHQFAGGVEQELRERHGALPPTIIMQPYPLQNQIVQMPSASEGDGIVRMVWAGQIWPPNAENPKEMYPVSGILPALEQLLEQGFGVEVYCDPAKGTLLEDETFAPYQALRRCEHFHFGTGTTPDRISRYIAHCDFGLILFDLDFSLLRVSPSKLTYQIPNKLFTYLEAGLPVIVNAENVALARFVEDHGIGIVVQPGEIPEVSKRTSANDIKHFRENVARYVNENSMSHHIETLIELYEGNAR